MIAEIRIIGGPRDYEMGARNPGTILNFGVPHRASPVPHQFFRRSPRCMHLGVNFWSFRKTHWSAMIGPGIKNRKPLIRFTKAALRPGTLPRVNPLSI